MSQANADRNLLLGILVYQNAFVTRDALLAAMQARKEIQDRHADDANSRARFVLEAEITGGFEHPGIVPVYGLGTYADGVYRIVATSFEQAGTGPYTLRIREFAV
jgi:hypothetical protein